MFLFALPNVLSAKQHLIRSRRADCKRWQYVLRSPVAEARHLTQIRCESGPNEQIKVLLAALEDWHCSPVALLCGKARHP